MNIAVVDDEKVILEQISGLVRKQMQDCCLDSYATGEEVLEAEKRLDIVFLDIQMGGMDGIETARRLRERQDDIVLIFVTGNREYVFDALDLYAFHYLLKPVDENKFREVLERAAREVAKKVEIHTARSKDIIEIYATMEELEGQLGEDFYRCHRAYIVNMAHITEYDNDSITMTNGDKVYLTKKKYGDFVKAYDDTEWQYDGSADFPISGNYYAVIYIASENCTGF